MEKILETQAQRKGAALRRRMRSLDRTQEEFAASIRYKGRQMISKWWKGVSWPQDSEDDFERILQLPAGFFARIGSGMTYEQAMLAGQVRVLSSSHLERRHEALMDESGGVLEANTAYIDTVQAAKMRKLLAYLARGGTLRRRDDFVKAFDDTPRALVEAWIHGEQRLPPWAMKVIYHDFEVFPTYWSAPETVAVEDFVDHCAQEGVDDVSTRHAPPVKLPNLLEFQESRQDLLRMAATFRDGANKLDDLLQRLEAIQRAEHAKQKKEEEG